MSHVYKVLYVANSSQIGGGNKVLLDILKHIDYKKFSATVVCPGEGQFPIELGKLKVPVFIVNPEYLFSSYAKIPYFTEMLKMAWWMINNNFHLLHANGPMVYRSTSIFAYLWRMKRICHLHYPDVTYDSLKWAYKISPHAIVACNHKLAEDVRPIIDKLQLDTKVLSVNNAIDTDKFNVENNISEIISELRNELNPSNIPVVTIIGHIGEVKGHKYFLEMAALLKYSNVNAIYLIVGDDKSQDKAYLKNMKEYALELGVNNSVKFLGFRNDILNILAISDIVVQCSLEEGLPLTILEAMACKKPVIATPVGGVGDVITEKINGMLVPVKDSHALKEAVSFLINNKEIREKIGNNAFNYIKEHHNLNSYVKYIENIYLNILKNRR